MTSKNQQQAINFDDASILSRRETDPLDQGEADRARVSKRGGSQEAVENTKVGRKRGATPLTKEVDGLAVMVAHQGVSPEETTKLLLPDLFVDDQGRLAPNLYEAPFAEVEHVERETESYIAWIIVLGFVAYALALYWAHKCRKRGGHPDITFSVLRGFVVKCYK